MKKLVSTAPQGRVIFPVVTAILGDLKPSNYPNYNNKYTKYRTYKIAVNAVVSDAMLYSIKIALLNQNIKVISVTNHLTDVYRGTYNNVFVKVA